MEKELPERQKLSLEDTWDLSDMYADLDAFEEDIVKVNELIEQIEIYKNKVGLKAENLLKTLDLYMDIQKKISTLYTYGECVNDQDTGDTKGQSVYSKAMSVYAKAMSSLSFVDPEILQISQKDLAVFFDMEKNLLGYKKYIDEIFRLKTHTLTAELEKLLASSIEMGNVPSNTFSVLSNSDLSFPEVEMQNGEKIRITGGRFVRLLESENQKVRKETFEKYYGVYKQFLGTFASLYDGQVKQQIFIAKNRNYKSNLEASVDGNNVPVTVYHNLIEGVNKNLDKLHRYVSIRKKCLKLKELHMYDIYTPMVQGVTKKYSYEEAMEMVLNALFPMGEEYLDIVNEAFANRWIDIYENKGKRGGAYSTGAYGFHPYMLLNFNGSLDDVFTLIHEMGHSIHTYYSNKEQPYQYANYKIFVAEVASTCNEILLLEYLLNNISSKKERLFLLNHYLDMFKGTVFRQTQFAEFELLTNEIVENGEGLNSENLSSLYKEINEKYYGPEMISDEQISYEWARIPHFYYKFYVYQYATSFCAAVAIAQNILKGGEKEVSRYKEFLSGGCSMSPVELLKRVGVDMTTSKPIDDAMKVMEKVLEEFEKEI